VNTGCELYGYTRDTYNWKVLSFETILKLKSCLKQLSFAIIVQWMNEDRDHAKLGQIVGLTICKQY
jgi:hypothetical protein